MAKASYNVPSPSKRIEADDEKPLSLLVRIVPERHDNEENPEEVTTPERVLLRVQVSEDVHLNCDATDLTATAQSKLADVLKAAAKKALEQAQKVS